MHEQSRHTFGSVYRFLYLGSFSGSTAADDHGGSVPVHIFLLRYGVVPKQARLEELSNRRGPCRRTIHGRQARHGSCSPGWSDSFWRSSQRTRLVRQAATAAWLTALASSRR